MKQNGISLNTQDLNMDFDILGDQHIGTSLETPLRDDAFDMPDELKIRLIEKNFREIMEIMGLDLTDDSLK